jgi:hypothetical protein
MAEEEKACFELLRSGYLPALLRHLAEMPHNTFEDSLLLALQFGAWRFCLTEPESTFQFSVKTVGIR